ncbi:hypothetical protein GIB67_031763 [Kingdonia uniflora]|uniref:Chromodomain-helicase-DNA-binding protein 1-like C-terminal domain-containing protein n=1 Tax=Kingdonia uniflora TaxID=39325 RepID=A0A7J7NKS8_9MAGN|nr:hypothetical protein GIB67_031763 [Kingdonia uniflora]
MHVPILIPCYYFYQEFAAVGGNKSKVKGAPKNEGVTNNHFKSTVGRPPKPNVSKIKEPPQKRQKVEPMVKEEGEMSDTEIYEQFKKEKWKEWCADVMIDEEKTLKCLEKLQHTSADLPKEKVLSKIRKYLQRIGRKIDEIVQEHEESHKPSKLSTRLWNYVSNFSNQSGKRLLQIYSKLKQEQQNGQAGMRSSSYLNSSAPRGSGERDNVPCPLSFTNSTQNLTRGYQNEFYGDQETGKSEAWKRRRRDEVQPSYHQPLSNGNPSHELTSLGILGRGPADNRRIGSVRPNRTNHAF